MSIFIDIYSYHIFCIRFWQGPEIAHYDAFGYGYKTWEWTIEDPIRSPVYHFTFSIFYSLLKMSGLDQRDLVVLDLLNLNYDS